MCIACRDLKHSDKEKSDILNNENETIFEIASVERYKTFIGIDDILQC